MGVIDQLIFQSATISFNSNITLILSLSIIFFLFHYFILYPLFFHELAHVPGPIWCKLSYYYISWYDLKLERNEKIAEWHRQYGPVICIRPNEVSFSDPELMREIYSTMGKYTKSDFFDKFITYGKRALFSIGPYWEHQHKRMLISQFYSNTGIYQPVVEEFVRERLAALLSCMDEKFTAGRSTSVNLYPMFNCFSFDNITRLLYGPRHCAYTIENDQKVREILLDMKQTQIWSPINFSFPWIHGSWILKKLLGPGYTRSLSAEHELAEWNCQQLTAAKEDKDWEKDHTLLRRMRTVNTKDGKPLNPNYIASEIFDHLNAAQETVAVSLVYINYHLARCPDWQEKIREELRSLPVADDQGLPSFKDLNNAPLFGAFVREVHRKNPGASGRAERYVPTGGKAYSGIFIPERTRVSASTIALHHDPTAFPDSDVFRPERWLEAKPEQKLIMDRAYIPFGYGARICLGKAFARLELKLLTAALVLKYRMRPDWEKMTERDMWQTGTMDSVPCGLKCVLVLERL